MSLHLIIFCYFQTDCVTARIPSVALLLREDYMRDCKIRGGHIYRKQAWRAVMHSERTARAYIVRLTMPIFEICLNNSYFF